LPSACEHAVSHAEDTHGGDKEYKGDACRFFYLPVPYEQYGITRHTYETWWMNKPLRDAVNLEFKKFIYYFFT